MDMIQISSFLVMGLGLGLLHAFDPDHLAAVGGCSTDTENSMWRTALHWSIGHGGVLFLIALLVILFGLHIPDKLSHIAESLVGYMLVAIGCLGFYRLIAKAQFPAVHQGNTGATMVGMLHGTAGSAPLLTLLPMSKIEEPAVGLVYVICFCVGVSLAMTGLGGAMEKLKIYLHKKGRFGIKLLQFPLSLFALLFGIYLLST